MARQLRFLVTLVVVALSIGGCDTDSDDEPGTDSGTDGDMDASGDGDADSDADGDGDGDSDGDGDVDGDADTDASSCGDGVLNGDDQCDGDDFGGETCESLGLGTGQLECTDSCEIDSSRCCEPECAGRNCGPDGCGGECGPCDPPDACCDGRCVGAPSSCECVCHCSLDSNPNCREVDATSELEDWDCDEVCANACSLGCGDLVSSRGDCPPRATCD